MTDLGAREARERGEQIEVVEDVHARSVAVLELPTRRLVLRHALASGASARASDPTNAGTSAAGVEHNAIRTPP
jgi:hypothetical protein